MKTARKFCAGRNRIAATVALVSFCAAAALATDWTQFHGTTGDGYSPDPISTNWPVQGPTIVWTNISLTNGFSSFAVSQGRAFTMISQSDGNGGYLEVCACVDAATGTNIWATPVGTAPWDPTSTGVGGYGTPPYDTGDGPRGTPCVQNGIVIVLSGLLQLFCLNATNGSIIWSNNLVDSYGATGASDGFENSSPRLDNGLIYLNLNNGTSQNIAAFRASDGSLAWSNLSDRLTDSTPTIATIFGNRQVIFASTTALVGLDSGTGNLLWRFSYPWGPIYTSMGASPIVSSNIVYCTAGYNRGSAAVQIQYSGGQWYATNLLWTQTYPSSSYQSEWMTPVVQNGYIYGPYGSGNYLVCPLNCINLANGTVMWSQPNFGKGGVIFVNQYVLALTEDGQLVLVSPDPSGYHELARYQAFHFDDAHHGKCWMSPAFSNGRIYARSTTGGICLDVSVARQAPLKLFPPQFLSNGQIQLIIGTADGSPISASRAANVAVHATSSLGTSPANWPALTNPLVLMPDGRLWQTNTINLQSQQFYIAIE
jgi:outer membrane protein assembly factor BamB